MIEIEHQRGSDVIVVRASGTLTANDYDRAIPKLENEMELAHGPLRILMRLEDFQGWEIGALWRELEFDLKHRRDFGRIAVVGESRLAKWGTTLSAPFSKADMRFFSADREAEAVAWLEDRRPRAGAARRGRPDGT